MIRSLMTPSCVLGSFQAFYNKEIPMKSNLPIFSMFLKSNKLRKLFVLLAFNLELNHKLSRTLGDMSLKMGTFSRSTGTYRVFRQI